MVLNQYQQLNYVVEQMLQLAQDKQWESLLVWHEKYQQLSNDLMSYGEINSIEQLSHSQQKKILMHIKNILNYQQQLTQLINVQHTNLGQLIGEKVNQRAQIQNYYQVANLT